MPPCPCIHLQNTVSFAGQISTLPKDSSSRLTEVQLQQLVTTCAFEIPPFAAATFVTFASSVATRPSDIWATRSDGLRQRHRKPQTMEMKSKPARCQTDASRANAGELVGVTAMAICQHARLRRLARRRPQRLLAVLNHWSNQSKAAATDGVKPAT